ncbi:MAG: Gfo/Idh/MocA family oxidoreductase [Armatimonadetes bacterium]|nr:Gfo/Idh/MocA family oxidoreductase [Armatimonadota bacterium]
MSKVTRRDLLKGTVATLAVGTIGATAPSSVLGANDRVNIGFIGVGGRGTAILKDFVGLSQDQKWNIKVVAVCDVDKWRLNRAVGIVGRGCRSFIDYRELLQMPDLDAVVIATPDHWHAQMMIDAIKAGKDVYCEKPMTRTWKEAKEVVKVARNSDRIIQIGAQSASDSQWWLARELLASDAVGKILWTQSSLCRNSIAGEWNYPFRDGFDPKDVDWDRWLGPAPRRPFDMDRYFRWRKYWDYSGGIATDLFYHQLAHLAIALGPELPTRVVAGGGIWLQKDREVPDTFHVIIDYPSEHSVVLMSSMANDVGVQEIIRGHEATMYFEGNDIVIVPQLIARDKRREERHKAPPSAGHYENWLECMRSRKQPNLNPETAYKVMVAIGLSVEAYRENKAIRFDPKKEDVVA